MTSSLSRDSALKAQSAAPDRPAESAATPEPLRADEANLPRRPGHPNDVLEERLSYLFHKASARIASIGNMHFKELQLNHFSARMLVLLLEHGELRTGELVDLMKLPQSTISTQLTVLQKKRLISKRRSRQDNRNVNITLTAQGSVVARDCNELSQRVQEQIIQGMSPSELASGYRFLAKIDAQLSKIQDHPLFDFHPITGQKP